MPWKKERKQSTDRGLYVEVIFLIHYLLICPQWFLFLGINADEITERMEEENDSFYLFSHHGAFWYLFIQW